MESIQLQMTEKPLISMCSVSIANDVKPLIHHVLCFVSSEAVMDIRRRESKTEASDREKRINEKEQVSSCFFFFFFCLTEVFMCVWLLILSGLDLDLCRWIKSLFLRSLQESLDCQ